jgi:hypothetical protein
VKLDFKFEREECGCGHTWGEHARMKNGSFACRHFGCGCQDVVYPDHVRQPTTTSEKGDEHAHS